MTNSATIAPQRAARKTADLAAKQAPGHLVALLPDQGQSEARRRNGLGLNAPDVHRGGEDKSQILPEVTRVFPVPDVNHKGFGEAGNALGSTR